MEKEFNWYQEDRPKITEPSKGMMALVTMPVKVIFEWSDQIATDWDEDSNVLEYTSGYVMKVLPNQSSVYSKQYFLALGFTIAEKL